jgi:hypothetical protein
MDIIKKNIVSVICGLIALIAIAASFFPLGGYRQELQANLDKSKAQYSALSSLLSKQRKLPVLSPDTAEAQELKTFPNEEIIKKGQAVVTQVQAQSMAMRDTAVKLSAKQLLVASALPSPGPTQELQFPQEYKRVMLFGQNGELPAIAQKLQAGIPPTNEAIKAKLDEQARHIYETEVVKLNGTEEPMSKKLADEKIAKLTVELPEQMRQEVATTAKVYVSPDTFDVNKNIAAIQGQRPNVIDIWWAQVGLWVQDDVVTAIREANANGKNLQEAPVKHLVKVTVPPQFVTGAAAGAAVASTDPDADLPKNVAISPTGRISNGLFDVVHFTLSAIVAEADLPQFIRVLGNNRFITVYQIDVKAVDSATAEASGYYYGPQPVVSVTMQCEDLLMRKWTESLMPDMIKTMLGVTPAAAPAAAPTAAAQ